MGSTNKTAHYELPQFVANDKPSWLGDVNEAMEAIDTGIYGAKSSADGAQQTANNAVAGVASAGTRMDGIQTQLDTVATQTNQTATTVAGHTSSIATNSANINTLNSRMGSTDISAIGDGTVTGAISSIAQGGGGTGGIVTKPTKQNVDIASYTQANPYTCPDDGFITVRFKTGTANGFGTVVRNNILVSAIQGAGADVEQLSTVQVNAGDKVGVDVAYNATITSATYYH